MRISAKHEDNPIREEFNTWIGGGNTVWRTPTLFHLLMCRFREMSGRLQFDSVEKDCKSNFRYCPRASFLRRETGKVVWVPSFDHFHNRINTGFSHVFTQVTDVFSSGRGTR